MRIIARDASMMPLNEIDIYSSFIWTDRYNTNGDFELRVPCTEDNKNLFDQTRYLTIDKSDSIMVLEKRQIKTQVDKSDEYIISGRSADTLLDRRIIMGSMTFGTAPYDEQTNTTATNAYSVGSYVVWYGALCRAIKVIQPGDTFVLYSSAQQNEWQANLLNVNTEEQAKLTMQIDDIVAAMLNATVINPTDPTRRFSSPAWRYIYSTDPKIQEIKMAASFANTNLYDALSSLLVGAGLGWKVVYNEETETMDFSLYKGVDRSASQSDNIPVIFKPVLDNLASSDFITDDSGYKTCAYVVGAIDDKKTRTVSVADELGRVSNYEYDNPNYCTTWCQQVSLSGTGMSYERREVIIDASDIDRYQTTTTNYGSSSNDVAITETDYRSMLKTRGKSELMAMCSSYDLSAEILPDMFYSYGKDYSLGDTISIEDRFHHVINASITEYINSVDASGYKAYPTIETIGAVDGMDELINIFINNPVRVDANKCLIVPDIRNDLSELREQTYIAYYVKDLIDYFLDGHLIYAANDGQGGFSIIVPSWDDMDTVVLKATISEVYANPAAYPEANTRAVQFINFMKKNQNAVLGDEDIFYSLEDLASSVQ